MKEKELICYAHSLGNCSDIQSDEHYFTKGIFPSQMVYVRGHPWLNGGTKEVSKRTLGKRILCTKHNNMLSIPVDIPAIHIYKLFEDYQNKASERGKLKRSKIWRKDADTAQWISL
jgi:hypothetical protein